MRNRLKSLRNGLNITQKELASFLGINQNTYSYWENGKVKIDSDSLAKLSDYFDVSIDYLLGRTDIRKPTNGATILEEERIKSDYRKLPSEMKAIVTDTCDSFRSLLKEDISSQNKEHLSIYRNY